MIGNPEYAVIQIEDRRRGERLNAGIAIFTQKGVDIRVARRLEKLRALSNALDLNHVRDLLDDVTAIDFNSVEAGVEDVGERIKRISGMTPLRLQLGGALSVQNNAHYEQIVQRLLRELVDPEPAPTTVVEKRTRLASSFKAALKKERVLARKGEGLAMHRVVPNFAIAEGLFADFVLKNGSMHVIETVDVSSAEISVRKVVSDIAVSALVLEQARMTFGEEKTNSIIVYDASSAIERFARPSLQAAAHQGAELINWASSDDQRKLIVSISTLAEAIPTKRELRLAALHASGQRRFLIN